MATERWPRGSSKWWFLFGLFAGLAFEGRRAIVFFRAHFVVGLLLCLEQHRSTSVFGRASRWRQRSHGRTRRGSITTIGPPTSLEGLVFWPLAFHQPTMTPDGDDSAMDFERIRGNLVGWLAAGLILGWLQFDAMRQAFERLGLSSGAALGLLLGCAFGSVVNVPAARLRNGTLVALNAGGCIVPLVFATWVAWHARLGWGEMIIEVAVVGAASWRGSRVEPGVGVTMAAWVAPLAAIACSAIVDAGALAPLAYVGGTLGTLIGADLLRLREAANQDAAVLSIGGAGTRDGIFLAGVIAVLLA